MKIAPAKWRSQMRFEIPQLRYENRTCEVKVAGAILITQLRSAAGLWHLLSSADFISTVQLDMTLSIDYTLCKTAICYTRKHSDFRRPRQSNVRRHQGYCITWLSAYQFAWICHQAPVPLSMFRSNSKFDENSERSSFKLIRPITTIFCTRHDSDTVVTCAKYRCDRSSILETRAFWIFIEFRIRSKYV